VTGIDLVGATRPLVDDPDEAVDVDADADRSRTAGQGDLRFDGIAVAVECEA
jgi:hypothetical protein